MASFTLTAPGFPAGTTIDVYLASSRTGTNAPSGAVVTSSPVSSSGAVTFTGLAADTSYVAYATGRAVNFRTDPTSVLAAASSSGQIETSTDAFRFDETQLAHYKTAIAAQASVPVNILCIGDSIVEGTSVSTLPSRWVQVMLAGIRASLGISGGVGYVPTYYASSTMTDLVTFTGTTQQTASTVTYFGLGGRHTRMSAAATASFTFSGTGCDIIAARGSGGSTFTYTVDGGASQGPVSTTNASLDQSGSVTQIRGLADGAHTVIVTAAANFIYLEGFMVYAGDEASGVRLWESGHSSWRTADFIETQVTGQAGTWYDGYGLADPDLVVIALGTNDYGISTVGSRLTPRQYRTNLEALLHAVRGQSVNDPSIVLWEPAFRGDNPAVLSNGSVLGTWPDFIQQIRQLAERDGKITLFDANAVMGDQSTGANPLTNADKLHPSAAGHTALGQAMAALLASA